MDNKKRLMCIMLGAIYWALGLPLIRFAGELLFMSGALMQVFAYVVASSASAYVSLVVCERVLKLERGQLVRAFCIMSATALMLDGAAMTWFGELYTADPALRQRAAAWLLWTFGVGLLMVDALAPADKQRAA